MFDHRLMKRVLQLRLRLLPRDARLQTTHDAQPPNIAGRVGAFWIGIELWFQSERYRDVLSCADPHRAVKTFARDTDDGKRDVVEVDLFADDCRIAAETFLPIAMTQNGDRLCV